MLRGRQIVGAFGVLLASALASGCASPWFGAVTLHYHDDGGGLGGGGTSDVTATYNVQAGRSIGSVKAAETRSAWDGDGNVDANGCRYYSEHESGQTTRLGWIDVRPSDSGYPVLTVGLSALGAPSGNVGQYSLSGEREGCGPIPAGDPALQANVLTRFTHLGGEIADPILQLRVPPYADGSLIGTQDFCLYSISNELQNCFVTYDLHPYVSNSVR